MKKIILVVIIVCSGLFSANALDLIVLKDGNIIDAKVMEIHPSEIRYKRANNLNGPMIVIPSDRVFSIRYENGVVDVINAFPTNAAPANTAPRTGQASAQPKSGSSAGQTSVQPSAVSSAGQQGVISEALQSILNQMPAIKVAGNNLKFMFNGSTWTAMLNGENFSTGTISVEEAGAGNSSILTLKQTHIWPGAAANTAGKALGKLPGGGAATGALNTAQAITGPAGPVEASGTEIVLEYKAGPPAKLSFLRSQKSTGTAQTTKNAKPAPAGQQTPSSMASSGSSNGIIPESAVVFDGNGHKYEVIDESLSWEDAHRYCEERGGYLATITSKDEQKFIEDLISGRKSDYFIGGYRQGNKWQWVTGEPFDYKNWASGQPDNSGGKENKLEILGINTMGAKPGKWNDGASKKFPNVGFICEWD